MDLPKRIAADVIRNWQSLFLTGILYRVLAYIVLTPLLVGLLRLFLAVSGNTILADQDILLFILSPIGMVCLVLVGAVWLGIVALEMAALMAIVVAGEERNHRVRSIGALHFAITNSWTVILTSIRIIAWTLAAIAPFLVIVAGIYFGFLSDYDINYYLKEWPPVFVGTIIVTAILAAILAGVLLFLCSRWLFALPLVLFEDAKPSQALRLSNQRSLGHRRKLLIWTLVWIIGTSALSVMVTTVVLGIGQMMVPKAAGSLSSLVIAIGASLLVGFLANLFVNLVSTAFFASLLVNLYRRFGSADNINVERLNSLRLSAGPGGLRFTKGTICLIGLVGLVAATGLGIHTFSTIRLEDDVAVIAHRGASHAAPENTLAAIRLAIEEGADWVEIDVQETADGKVAVFHDSDFMKLAGVNLKIWDATVEDLKQIDVGSWMSAEFENERVPLLSDVLKMCKGKVKVDIELKYYGHDKNLEQRVIDLVEAHDMASEVMFMSLKKESVQKMKSLRPDWKVGLLMSVSAGNLKKMEADFLAVNASFADWGFIREAHAIDKQVLVWTVNDQISMSNMIGRGADGLITDKPGLARKVLNIRSQLSAGERLLLEFADIFGVPAEIGEQ